MKRTINEHDFVNAFQGTYKNQFSYEGKLALYEYLTQLEEDTGFEMELDAIGICCEYSEYEDFTEFAGEYEDYVKEHDIQDVKTLQEHTQVVEYKGGFIIQQF